MSEPKFTPGEWEVYHIPEDKGGKYEVSSNESPWWIALVGAPNENYEQAKANANLMAASKEMYYVLKRIIDDLPTKRDWLDPVLERMAKDALAKAEGGTHAD